jgi:hypothetical protein
MNDSKLKKKHDYRLGIMVRMLEVEIVHARWVSVSNSKKFLKWIKWHLPITTTRQYGLQHYF